MYLSKSKYCRGVQCNKMLWMDAHMPEEADDSCINQAVFDTGNAVGDLAMAYFGKYTEVQYQKDKTLMISETQTLLKSGAENICEASFSYKGNFCSVDILRCYPDGVDLVEVKSSTEVHDIYIDDMSYQLYVLSGCGLNVKHVYNLHLNSGYVRRGNLNLQELFTLVDCTEECTSK